MKDPRTAPTLARLLRERAQQQPERRAVSFVSEDGAREALSYAELDLRARAVGERLGAAGIAAGERAALAFPPGLDFVAAFFGCLYAGVIGVPVVPSLSGKHRERVLGIVRDADAAAVVTTPEVAEHMAGATGDLAWIAAPRIPGEGAAAFREASVAESAVALLQYTSGSTGEPKGVILTHRNLLSNLEQIHQGFDASPERSGLIWLPHFHDMGLIGGILSPIYSGYPVELMSPARFLKHPARWLEEISRYQITYSGGPNFAYEMCLESATEELLAGLDLRSWTVAFCGAEPVRASTLRRFHERLGPRGLRPTAFYPCYGLAEATLLVTGKAPDLGPEVSAVSAGALERGQVLSAGGAAEDRRELVACGRPWADTEIAIVDPDTRRRCAAGGVGEIWIRGGGVAEGYWRRPEATREVFENFLEDTGEGPFLRSGDLGFVSGEQLYVTGRMKDVIIIDGRNLYPQDIEATVEHSHFSFRKQPCICFSVDASGGERLIVVQEVKRQVQEDLDVLAASLRRAVSREHGVPVGGLAFVPARSLPKTSSGKLERRAGVRALLGGQLPVLRAWGLSDLVAARAPLPSPSQPHGQLPRNDRRDVGGDRCGA
ncbi:fatty acyl-AMP ligase [Sorangium sp. So ce269]